MPRPDPVTSTLDPQTWNLLAPSFRRRLVGFGLNSPDIVETEGLSANAPRAALHFLDDDLWNPAGLADERHDGFGDIVNSDWPFGQPTILSQIP